MNLKFQTRYVLNQMFFCLKHYHAYYLLYSYFVMHALFRITDVLSYLTALADAFNNLLVLQVVIWHDGK